MAITVADLKFFQSERMTDEADGGGRMTATEIVSGADNQIFDDVSDVDRAAGDVSIRKVYAAVTSPDTDKYLDAGVVVFAEPTDPNTSVLAFSTGSFYDERADLKSRLEQSISRGARYNGWLWGTHLIGQRALSLWQRPEAPLPASGSRIELVKFSAGVEIASQFCWITRVTDALQTIYEVYNGQTLTFDVRAVTLEIAEPLTVAFVGPEPARADPFASSATAMIYQTRYNAEAVPLFGVKPVVEAAGVGDFSVKVESLYSPLIPTAFTETALPDVTPGGDSPALIGGNAQAVSFSTTVPCIKPDAALYCGTGILPGTLSIAVSGSTLTDDNGAVLLAGTDVGSVDYGNGVVRWTSACPNYGTANKVVAFQPAARPLQVQETTALAVTAENRGFVWVATLAPIPAPGTLRASYRVNNQWYVLNDLGGGRLTGADSSYGSGSLNFSTGTVTLTTGALPDVGSDIILAWGIPAAYTARGGAAVDAPVVRATTAHPNVAPNTVTVTWGGFTLTDDGTGHLTGTGGVGFIRYATGEWWVRPTTIPAGNTEFQIEYDWGDPIEETFAHPLREGNGHLALALNETNLSPGSVEVEWNLVVLDYEAVYGASLIDFVPAPIVQGVPFDPIKIVRDDGAGHLPISGGTNGTVNYAAGTVDFLPDVTVSIPKPLYSNHELGQSSYTGGGGTSVYSNWRTTFDGWEYIPAGAQYPNDETGYVTVRYRVAGGDATATETVTLGTLEFDLTKGYAETLVAGSTRFLFGGATYVETAGQIYRNPGPDTGAGTLAGSLDRSSGRVSLSAWTAGGANAVTLQSLTTSLDIKPIAEVVFRTPVAPIKPGTLQLRWTTLTGAAKTKTVDGTGRLEDTDVYILVDALLGVVRARFGQWKNDADVTPAEKLEPWYGTDYRVTLGGVLKIWKPKPALADSIVYNAVAQTFLPPDSAVLGLDAARLPPDGQALIFNTGRLVLVHHTDSVTETSLSPTEVIDCGRVRLYRVAIEDADKKRLPADFYTVDRELGTVTMAPTLNLTGYSGPYKIWHTVADLARLVAVDISGTLSLNKALSHVYPEDEARVSGVLYAGTLQARVSTVFAQSTWDGVWSDTLRGSAPLADYNDALYPIATSNAGAYPDRILVKFTSSTAFQVIGENLGLIAVGDVNQNCAPVNSLTGETYFTLDYRGWGAGWATGNCLRFNLIGAAFPVDLVRAVQPSAPYGGDDSVELLFVGNVDA